MILFGKDRWDKSRPFSNKKYMYSYEYFYTLCKENGVQMYRASYQWYDYKKKKFKYAWSFEAKDGGWNRVYEIKPDLIYDKTKATPTAYMKNSLIRNDYPYFNNLEFAKIIDNKLAVSLLFPDWSQKSQVIKDNDFFFNYIQNFPSDKKIVLKPVNLSGGNGVLIGTKDQVRHELETKKITITDWISQDFIDSSSGIPGIMRGMHDLRLVIIDDSLVYSYFRKPANGSFLANLAQGGTMEIAPAEKLPSSLTPLIESVKRAFSGFDHKIYALDVMFDQNQKPWIVELNSMPGMYFAPGQEQVRKHFYQHLLNTFKKILT